MTTTAKSILFMATWRKYLPFIRVLMKKSAAAEQTLCMNRIDFEKGGKTKKWGYNFVINFVNKRPATTPGDDEFARAFIAAIQGDDMIVSYVAAGDYSFTLNNKYELVIRNTTVIVPSSTPVPIQASLV